MTDANNILRIENDYSVIINEGISGQYWASLLMHYNSWWDNGRKYSERTLEYQLDPDGVYRSVSPKYSTWFYENDHLSHEWTSVYKQNTDGYWRELLVLDEQWWISGNMITRKEYDISKTG